MIDRVAWKQLGLILIVALVLRVGVVVVWQQRLKTDFGFPDSESYWQLAQRLAAGERYVFQPGDQPVEYRVFRTPGYPAVLAPIFWIAEGRSAVWLARFQSVSLSVLTVALVGCVASQVFGWPTARIASLIAALYPEAIAAGAFILSESLFCPLMLAQLLFWFRAEQSSTPRSLWASTAIAGVFSGLAVLARPSWLLFVPLIGLSSVTQLMRRPPAQRSSRLREMRSEKAFRFPRLHFGLSVRSARCWLKHRASELPGPMMKRWLIVVIVFVVSVLTMLPWWWRNWRVTGCFVPTSLQVGASLYDGLNPSADGSSNMEFTRRFVELVLDAEGKVPLSGPQREVELNRLMRDEAIDWLRKHPWQAVQLAGRKFLRMWLPGPNDSALASGMVRWVVALTYVPVMLLALYGLWLNRHMGWPLALLWLPAVYFTGLHVVFVASIRYRLPAMLCLIVFAAEGIVCLWKHQTNRLADNAHCSAQVVALPAGREGGS